MTPVQTSAFDRLMGAICGRVLAMSEEGLYQLRSLSAVLPQRALDSRGDEPEGDEPRTVCEPFRVASDWFGNPLPRMFIRRDGVAVIPIKGMTTKGLGNIADYLGFADYDRIQDWLEIATGHKDVKAIALFTDSPGGMTVGSIETARAVMRADQVKPVMAFTDGLAASAAFKICSGARAIYSTPSAQLGSVGTFSYIPDATEYWKELGVEWIVFRSGEHKGVGIDKITEAQRAELQRQVDYLGGQFRDFIRSRRPFITEENMQGQVFTGMEAAEHGFAQGVAENFEEAISRFISLKPKQLAL